MNCKMSSFFLGAIALSSMVIAAPLSATGLATAERTLPGMQRGGQAPPNAAGGTARSIVVVQQDLPRATADNLQQSLISDGFTTAEVRRESSGNFRVILAGLPSSQEANVLLTELRDAGYSAFGIDEDTGQSATVYRVAVAEFSTRAEADQASQDLAAEDFVNVDVLEENGRFTVMMGTFNRREDAQNLLSDVTSAGFALAEVVERERIRAATPAGTLPTNMQQATRDVLSLAEKVESGEASADEFRQLRERTQQLPQDQRQILEQQEQSRVGQQQVFDIYRQFDRAMQAQNYAQAEQALAQVRQINPNELNLPNRERVLADARAGRSVPPPATDPARVQEIINEARRLESAGNDQQALAQYQQALQLDPNNIEARGKVEELSGSGGTRQTSEAAEPESAISGLLNNKPLLYGAGGLLALIIIVLLLKSRKSRQEPARTTSSTTGTGSDFYDPLADSTGTASATDTSLLGAGGSDVSAVQAGAAGAEMAPPAFATFGTDEDEEEKAPPPKPAPKPAVIDDDFVSFDDDDSPAVQTPSSESPTAADDVPLTFDSTDNIQFEPAPQTHADTAPAQTTSALDEDLESLLKGTFPGAPEDAEERLPLQSATPGDGVEDLQAPGAPAAAQSRVVFEQTFEDEQDGAAPRGWTGEYDYASLTVERLDEAGHAQCLRFQKSDGSGSATYHLSFPKASGQVTAEFDIRCDEKNKFLLGVYLEKDEDFKQSIHTIVHQLDPNTPAALRVQGVAAAYEMSTWRRVRLEIDLNSGIVNGYLDNEQVVQDVTLANAPDYINTLSIRDNLATTGTLLLDNIRISEA